MSEEKKNLGASSTDDTSALFVTARKKQLAEQEAQRKAAAEEAKRQAAEAEVRRLEAEVAARKRQAEEETRRLAEEAEERRRQAELDRAAEEKRMAEEAAERRRQAAAAAIRPQKAPKAPKAPKQAAGPNKKLLFIIAGAVGGAVLIALIVTLIVVFAGKSRGGYQPWVQPLTLSVDEYHDLSGGKQKKMLEQLDEIIYSEFGMYVVNAEEIDDMLYTYSSDETGSFARTVLDYYGANGITFVMGDLERIGSVADMLYLTRNDFTGGYFTYKLGAVTTAMAALIENGDIADSYNNVQMTADLFDQATKSDADDFDVPGSFFRDVCELFDLDPEETYNRYVTLYGGSMDTGSWDSGADAAYGYEVYEDAYYDLGFLYPTDMTVYTDLTTSASELATLSDGYNYLMIFDISLEYQTYDLTADDWLGDSVAEAAYEFFEMLYGETAIAMDTTSDVESTGSTDSIAYQTFTIETETGIYNCLADLRNPSYGDVYTMSILFTIPELDDNLEEFAAVIESLYQISAG